VDGEENGSLLNAAPGLARLAGGIWLRTAQWTAEGARSAASRVAKAAMSGESAAELIQEMRDDAREQARRVLGLIDPDDRVRSMSERMATGTPDHPIKSDDEMRRETLRDKGAALLDHSADVEYEETTHPAYERILDQLAPDEGRILRLLATSGPEPSVDVRTARPLNVGSQLVAPGLTMIGSKAGCRHVDRVPAYLNNLYRLGLVWFSREPVEDPLRYQVLEAQPDVLAAVREAGRGKTIRRSIHLTPFGADFCATCLPLDPATVERLRRAGVGEVPAAASE
jgi:hypothetical protein